MRYVKTFESFKNKDIEPVNEEFLGIFKAIGGMFKKAMGLIKATKGGEDVEKIYQNYSSRI